MRRGKRGNGEGSIYRRSDGKWVAALTMPGRRRKVLYGATREDVRRKLNVALGLAETGQLADSRGTTLESFLDVWLAEVAKPSVRHWTFKGYEVHVRVHLKPALGRMPLDRIEPVHVQRFLNDKLKSGLSPKSVRYLRGTLRTALNHAVRWAISRETRQPWSTGLASSPMNRVPLTLRRRGRFLMPPRVIACAPFTRSP